MHGTVRANCESGSVGFLNLNSLVFRAYSRVKVLQDVAFDLKSKRTCAFRLMVQGLITRLLMEDTAIQPTPENLLKADDAYRRCLQTAVRFCNLDPQTTAKKAANISAGVKESLTN